MVMTAEPEMVQEAERRLLPYRNIGHDSGNARNDEWCTSSAHPHFPPPIFDSERDS
jgi:hypothetical protein